MTNQPEALILAEAHEFLSNQAKSDEEKTIIVRLLKDSAAELRRLHSLNQELIEALKQILENDGGRGSKCFNAIRLSDARDQARAAIAKATGENNG